MQSKGIVIEDSKKVGNSNIYYVLDALQKAIKDKKKITFQYGEIGKERRLDNGGIKQYILSPYRILLVDQVYYLVGNYDKYDDLSHYRVEKIQGIQVLDNERIKPLEHTTYKKKELDIIHYIKCNFGMFAGEVSGVTLQCHWEVEEIVRNKFGSDILIGDKQEASFMVRIECVIGDAFIRWLIGFSDYIKIIEPVTLREEIRERIQKMAKMQE